MGGDQLARIPYLGSGLGYREELAAQLDAARERIDVVEVLSERYTWRPQGMEELAWICDRFKAIPHGLNLSIGSMAPLDRDHLRAIRRVSELTGAPYYSEHLAMTRVPGIDLGHLTPLLFTEEVLERTTGKVRAVQDTLGKPLVLENVTYDFEIPGGMPQPEFFSRLVEATGCGILLDVTNLWINSVNHHFDPVAFLDEMPLEQVVHVHVSGGYWEAEALVDGHSEPVQEESWRLLEALARRSPVKTVILEHDDNYPPLDQLLPQVDRARAIVRGTEPAARVVAP
jgi:uncharacterized protein (UPF0276 family)